MFDSSVKKVLLFGSGGLRIGQAGEFDYSGSQAIKALKSENIEVILLNPNIATVQTDFGSADKVYFLPINFESALGIIKKHRPDSILISFGGQTALNLGLELEDKGVLSEYNVRVLGTSLESVRHTEDRELFKRKLAEINIKTPVSKQTSSEEEAVAFAKELGFPIMLRVGFSLGGLGSGKISNEKDLRKRLKEVLSISGTVLIEEYLGGWKEIEYEIARDFEGNVITVCNMENFDSLGIHTGESIVICPSQTLNNNEYHILRNIAINVANHFKIIGECNIQYAVNPKTFDYRVIELNARLSRSSALASKATGYPLAFVAAQLALNYSLAELKNSVNKTTSAFFEPALDYIVVKMPKWDTHKLRFADRTIGSEMKSVGEVMAIGRSFQEALQKAVRMCNLGVEGLFDYPYNIENPEKEIEHATDRRLFAIIDFLLQGNTAEAVHLLSGIDLWFLFHLESLVKLYLKLKFKQPLTKDFLLSLKQSGFSDQQIATATGESEDSIRQKRLKENIVPVIKQIDTLAGEFKANTNYLYLTYWGEESDVEPLKSSSYIVLGSGPYSIGSSVEFDWCAVNAVRKLKKFNKSTIVINSNPETVSTDYDESERLYFEELSLERVRDISDFEKSEGIIVSVGGQIANNLVKSLDCHNYKILGTPAKYIDLAEDRKKFSFLLKEMGIDQPEWIEATSLENALEFVNKIGLPVLLRPSYVLSGAAMNVIYDISKLEEYLASAFILAKGNSVVISKFITAGKEFEIDGVAQDGEIIIKAFSEHIEYAGVHSGDATIVLPPQKIYLETIRSANLITKKIIKALNVTGPFNIQFIAKREEVKVIECNLRASRSFPFVSKVTGHNFISLAMEALFRNRQIEDYPQFNTLDLNYVGVKAPFFSYNRLKGANPVAAVEMASTGEVATIGENLLETFFSSWLATEQDILGNRILLSIGGEKKEKIIKEIAELDKENWIIYTTSGTHDYLSQNGIASFCLFKASEKKSPNVCDAITMKQVDIIINIPSSADSRKNTDGFYIRRLAIDHKTPLITDLQMAKMFLQCLILRNKLSLKIKSWDEYVKVGSYEK